MRGGGGSRKEEENGTGKGSMPDAEVAVTAIPSPMKHMRMSLPRKRILIMSWEFRSMGWVSGFIYARAESWI